MYRWGILLAGTWHLSQVMVTVYRYWTVATVDSFRQNENLGSRDANINQTAVRLLAFQGGARRVGHWIIAS